MAYNKDRAIVAQNSNTGASAIVAALVQTGEVTLDTVVDVYSLIRSAIFEGTLALADGVIAGQTEAQAAAASAPSGGGRTSDAGAGVNLKFGKHAGKTIAEVYALGDEGASYVQWLAETSNNDFIKGKAAEYLASVA